MSQPSDGIADFVRSHRAGRRLYLDADVAQAERLKKDNLPDSTYRCCAPSRNAPIVWRKGVPCVLLDNSEVTVDSEGYGRYVSSSDESTE